MRKTVKTISLILCLILISIMLFSCNKNELLTNVDYMEYIFDNASNQYIETGRKLRINEQKSSFTMTFINNTSVIGALEIEQDINGLILQIEDEAFAPFKAAYVEYLREEYADTYNEETINAIINQITIQEQMYYKGKHIFSSRSMQLMKAVSEKDKNVNYSMLEGIYDSIKDDDTQYLFKNGLLFRIENDVVLEKPDGRYTINENYVTVTRLDDAGELLYKEGNLIQTKYLYSTISYPSDFLVNVDVGDEDYNNMLASTAKLMAGKTLAVLTNSFYLAK